MKRIGLNEVHTFIRNKLKHELRGDLRGNRIRREGDIECCVYSRLRSFLNSDSDWRIFAHKYDKRTGYYPDLLVYRKHQMTLPIEIKWNRKKISTRDREKLGKYLSGGLSKGYFITVGPDVDDFKKPSKEDEEKWHLFVVRTGLKFKGGKKSQRYRDWRKERRRFKA